MHNILVKTSKFLQMIQLFYGFIRVDVVIGVAKGKVGAVQTLMGRGEEPRHLNLISISYA